MLPLDDTALYDLADAGRLLFCDAHWLRRRARRRLLPFTFHRERMVLPRDWVEAEAGIAPLDAEALRGYWLSRLAPPAPGAARPRRDRRHLPCDEVLSAKEAARRVTADPLPLEALDAEGVLPPLRVDGQTAYDAELVALVAREDEDPEVAPRADARRAAVKTWARYEYVTDLDEGRAPPPATTRADPAEAIAAAPRAWHIPEDLAALPAEETTGPSVPSAEEPPHLIEADGFETVDEEE
ncbi:MAG: hypothetical protein ACC662_10195 [Planctomycetota bacterium]